MVSAALPYQHHDIVQEVETSFAKGGVTFVLMHKVNKAIVLHVSTFSDNPYLYFIYKRPTEIEIHFATGRDQKKGSLFP